MAINRVELTDAELMDVNGGVFKSSYNSTTGITKLKSTETNQYKNVYFKIDEGAALIDLYIGIEDPKNADDADKILNDLLNGVTFQGTTIKISKL